MPSPLSFPGMDAEHFSPLFDQIAKLDEALYNIQFEQHWLEAQTDRQAICEYPLLFICFENPIQILLPVFLSFVLQEIVLQEIHWLFGSKYYSLRS